MKLAHLAALPLLALVFAACGAPQNVSPTVGSFALTINPASVTVTQGSSASVTVTLDRQNGFAGAVGVSLANPPEGVAGQAVTIPAGAVSVTLGLSAEDSVAVGALTLKLSGVAGSLTQSVSFGLTVTPASNPDFVLSLTPGSLALAQGSGGAVTVNVMRLNGFTDPVALQLSGAPQGVSASALSVPAGADSATLNISTDATAALVSSQLSVSGASGTLSHSAPLSLTVLNASAPDFNLALSPASLSIVSGSTTEVNFSLTRVNGFAGDVTLSLTNPPAGITAPDVTMTAASSAAKLALSVSSAAANGNALLNFTAVGAGLTKTFNLPIAVSAPTPPDTTAPTISQRLPAEGMTGVSPDSKISLTFSEPMNTSAVQVLVSSLAENADLGTATWTNSNKTVTFAPVGGLKATAYTISATGADEAGNDLVAAQSKSGFIVSLPLDTTPPQLSSSQPVDLNSLSPAAGAGFSLQFSEPMAAGTLGAISFKQNVGLVSVPVTCAWLDASHVNVTCKHPSVLSYSSAYAVVISAAAKDIAGNALTVTVVQYYTAANADTVQPSILGFTPSANSSGVAAAAVIAVTFSEPMDKASTQTAFAFTSPAGVSASYTWNPQGTVLTVKPSAAFAYGQTVTWNVSSVNAHDVSGNSMQISSDLPHSFKVTQIGVVKLYAVGKTLDGAMYPNSLQADYQLLFGVAQACCSTYSRAFMSFDLSKLPNFAAITKIQTASLNVYQNQDAPSGSYGASGNVLAENIYYPILFPTYFNAPTISAGATNVLSTSRNKGSRSMDVTAQLVYDYKNRASLLNRSQWRLRFAHEFASVNEFAYLGDNTSPLAERPYLNVTYFYP